MGEKSETTPFRTVTPVDNQKRSTWKQVSEFEISKIVELVSFFELSGEEMLRFFVFGES